MLAPNREQVSALNHQAREHRLRGAPPRYEVRLSDGNHASIGDMIVTRQNDRRLRAGGGWVKTGDRWQVDDIRRDGSLVVRDPRTHRKLTLPGRYVSDHVELGYASTIHGAQGMTADTCHGLVTGPESREQLSTMLSRGRHSNHAYVEVTGDDDRHARLLPDTITPPTSTERLEAILARSDVPLSATSQLAAQRDPRTLLGVAVACYQDAIVVAAEQFAGPDLIQRLEKAAAATGLGLTEADAWPVLRSHLCVVYAQGVDPFGAVLFCTDTDGINEARDPAAVADHELSAFARIGREELRPSPGSR